MVSSKNGTLELRNVEQRAFETFSSVGLLDVFRVPDNAPRDALHNLPTTLTYGSDQNKVPE